MTKRKKAALAATFIVVGFPAWGFLGMAMGVALEFWTIGNNYPISWLLYDAPRMSVFLATAALVSWVWFQILIIVGLAIHAWWPAKSRWIAQDEMIEKYGEPNDWDGDDFGHAQDLWKIHTGAKT